MPFIGLAEGLVLAAVRRQGATQRASASPRGPGLVLAAVRPVLRRRVGTERIMQKQLSKLAEWSERPNISIHVVSFSAGSYPGIDGTYTILEFAEREVPDVVYVEGLVGQIFLDRPADVARYRRVHTAALTAALSTEESRDLLHNSAQAWR